MENTHCNPKSIKNTKFKRKSYRKHAKLKSSKNTKFKPKSYRKQLTQA